MTAPALDFADPDDQPIRYIERTHAWYRALGFDVPYRYAQFSDVPFTRVVKPLAQSRVALLTTAVPFDPTKGGQNPRTDYNADVKFYTPYSLPTADDHDMRVSHVAVDRAHISQDSNCWFPLPALRRAAASGRIGGLTGHFHGVPTNRSQRHTMLTDAPDLLRRVSEDRAEVAVLVPNCPVCHQTMSLVARHLEANGIPTVIMGAAKDIVELCGVPRFLFSDVPLGNACGLPFDTASQDATLALALATLEHAPGSRTTVQNPLKFPAPPAWHRDFYNLATLSPDDIAREREANARIKATAKTLRETTLGS